MNARLLVEELLRDEEARAALVRAESASMPGAPRTIRRDQPHAAYLECAGRVLRWWQGRKKHAPVTTAEILGLVRSLRRLQE